MEWVGYLLVSLPNAVVLAGGLLLALFPSAVLGLERKPGLRYTIAGALVVLAVIIWVTSAAQMHRMDADLTNLRNGQSSGFQTIGQQISAFAATAPRVPRLAVHLDEGEIAYVVRGGQELLGVNVTITNDGDDATFAAHYVSAVSNTPSGNGAYAFMKLLIAKVANLPDGKPAILRHGESSVSSAVLVVPLWVLSAIKAGVDTAYFGITFDVKTVSGKHKRVNFCAFYQGLMLVEAC